MRLWNWMARIFGRADSFVAVQEVRQMAADSSGMGQGRSANVVMAPLHWIMRTFTQADPIVEKRRGGRWKVADEHPLATLLEQPNPFYDGDAMLKALVLSFFVDGNAYCIKVRDNLRRVVGLWYVPHWLMEPKWDTSGRTFITHYEYRPFHGMGTTGPLGHGMAEDIHPSDVVHLRNGLDPDNPRKGLSQLKTVLREVVTDEEASKFSSYILRNMGVPGGVISPKTGERLPSADDVKAMKEYMSNFKGMNRGDWLVIGAPTEVAQFGFDPNRLMLGPLRDISEERVCAILGVPAAVVGFGAGLQSTKVGATMREMVRMARVNCIEPAQFTFARQLSRQLMPDFEPRPNHARVWFDNSAVPMFAEDEMEATKRVALMVEKGLLRVDRGQEMLGLEVDDSQAIYLRPSQSVAVTPGGEPAPMEPGNRIAGLLNGNSKGAT
jgi:HK97 family phage portal protein